MLKRNSRHWNFAVALTLAMGSATAESSADADDLSFTEEISVSTGLEKASADELRTPGVSFPTRLYAQHASAYRHKTIALELVQVLTVVELDVEGHMKSLAEEGFNIAANQNVVELPENAVDPPEEVPVEIAKKEPTGVWRKRNDSLDRFDVQSANLETPEIGASTPYGEIETENVQTVHYQDQAEETSGLSPVDYDAAARLSNSLSSVALMQAVRFDSELPDEENKAKEIMSTAGTEHQWKSGGWISVRPPRNTFPFQQNPLYFEDPNLERCGRTTGCLTDATSVIRFAGRIPILPYMMTVEPPRSLVASKGDCPTDCAYGWDGYIAKPNEIDLGGVAVQAAVTVGLIFLIP